ncbi:hypothetical protein SOVF_028810 [Spinacia oleracea]|nr:hypothetical protein SOVF_028810 [Spinacia oleracea]
MSALQHPPPTTSTTKRRRSRRRTLSFPYCSPSTIISESNGEVWRVRDNELALEEIIRRHRKLGFESGRLRGRRLFQEESDDDDEDDYYDYDHDYDYDYDYDEEDIISSVCDEVNVDEVVVKEVTSIGNGKRKMLIVVGLMVFILLITCFILIGGFDEHVSEVKFVVLPT